MATWWAHPQRKPSIEGHPIYDGCIGGRRVSANAVLLKAQKSEPRLDGTIAARDPLLFGL
jgi:hypothetical protein